MSRNRSVRPTRALLPGSYDPITQGHMDIIRRAASMFDEVIVAVMTNDMAKYAEGASSKTYMFSMAQRAQMAAVACLALENVRVVSSSARLIDLFDEVGANVIVKGVRNEADYAYEQKHALWNRAHNARAETLYLPADPAYDHISSTLVRERLAAGETTEGLLPEGVETLIDEFQKGAGNRHE